MAIEITLDTSRLVGSLERLVPEMDDAFDTAMALVMADVVQEAAIRAPLKTGELILSIGSVQRGTFSRGTLSGVVSASAPHAASIEDGSKPHVIRPKKKRALRWPSGGTGANGWAFAKKVNHPGTRAQPFLKPALAAKRDGIADTFEKATRLAIRKAGFR